MIRLELISRRRDEMAPSVALSDVLTVGAVFFCTLFMQFFSPYLRPWLELSSETIDAGKLWCFFSAHYIHANWSHWGINAASLVAFFCLFPEMLRAKILLLALTSIGLPLGLCLWLILPENVAYLGLSGLLYGLLAAASIVTFKRNVFSLWVLGFLVIKIAWEQLVGPIALGASLSGGVVSTAAHFFGVAIGLVSGLCLRRVYA